METNWCGMISYYGNPINFRAALGINQSWQATLVVFYFCNNSCSSPWNDLSLITADRNEDHGRHSAMYVCRSAPRGEDASWSRWAPTPALWFGCWDFVALGEEVFLWGLLPFWWLLVVTPGGGQGSSWSLWLGFPCVRSVGSFIAQPGSWIWTL